MIDGIFTNLVPVDIKNKKVLDLFAWGMVTAITISKKRASPLF